MDWLYYIIISVFSGAFAGMGMGGGTFLIPLLILITNTPQTEAQAQNLVVFVPMAIVVGIIYACQKLIDWKRAWIVALPATVLSVVAALVAVNLSGRVLCIIFGAFVAAVGFWQLVLAIIRLARQKRGTKTQIKTPAIKTDIEK